MRELSFAGRKPLELDAYDPAPRVLSAVIKDAHRRALVRFDLWIDIQFDYAGRARGVNTYYFGVNAL